MPKKPATFRLSDDTIRQLARLAKQYGISQADVIAVLVHCFSMGYVLDEWEAYFNLAKQLTS